MHDRSKGKGRGKYDTADGRAKVRGGRSTGRPTSSASRWVWEWAKSLSVAIVLFLVIRAFVVEAFKIPTGSMERTLLVGDWLLVNKAVYGAQVPFTGIHLPAFESPARRDVVVFQPPFEGWEAPYVKRVVGMPGDEIAMREGQLYLNGALQEEEYVQRIMPETDYYDPQFEWQRSYLASGIDRAAYRPTRDNWGPLVVPAGKYFVMGDNRDNSQDSRYWGFVDRELIKGRPLFVYYSFDRSKLRPMPWLTEVRWNRIGEAIR